VLTTSLANILPTYRERTAPLVLGVSGAVYRKAKSRANAQELLQRAHQDHDTEVLP
jgi:hypothetical protein